MHTKLFLFLITVIVLSNCVQKSSKKTVVVKLNVAGLKNIQSVGLRGNEKPLSWDYDLKLKPVIKDSLFSTTFSLVTGYKFTEAKFTVNGQFELNEKENRKIVFTNSDTTVYEAVFNIIKNN